MPAKILLGQCYKNKYNFGGNLFQQPSRYRSYLLETYPEIEHWVTPGIFDKLEDWPDGLSALDVDFTPRNTAGRFIAANIDTPCKVIDEPLTIPVLTKELAAENYTHVGLGIFIDSYSQFKECSVYIRENYPHIQVIAGNIGALHEDTATYADHVCLGDGIVFLRRLFGEDENKPLRLELIPVTGYIKVMGLCLKIPFVQIVTQIGCPMKCDFCSTALYFNCKHKGPLFSPEQVYEALVSYRKKINKNFTTFIVDPTAIVSYEWWYKLFDLFRFEKDDYPVIITTTQKSLVNLDLNKAGKSAIRLDTVNIGVESFHHSYPKNSGVDLKALIREYKEYGIAISCSYIIGFEHNTADNVLDEMKQLLELETFAYSVMNLHPIPGTPLWKQLAAENRLLDVPFDYYYLCGFQPFEHPAFETGFKDMLPLMCRIHRYIEREEGPFIARLYEIVNNLIRINFSRRKNYSGLKKIYKMTGSLMYPEWKDYLKPAPDKQSSYEERLGLSSFYKMLTEKGVFRKLIKILAEKMYA